VLTTDSTLRIQLLTEAARRTTSDPTYAFLLGEALAAAGRAREALAAYATAVAISPDLIKQFPSAAAADAPASDDVERAVGGVLDSIATQTAISKDAATWDLDLAADSLPADAGAQWRAVDLARKGDANGAAAAIQQAERESPYDETTLAAALAVDRLTCDEAAFERVEAWVGPYRPARPTMLSVIREHVYREDALSSYLPPQAQQVPPDTRWPWAFIGQPPACPGWPSAPAFP